MGLEPWSSRIISHIFITNKKLPFSYFIQIWQLFTIFKQPVDISVGQFLKDWASRFLDPIPNLDNLQTNLFPTI